MLIRDFREHKVQSKTVKPLYFWECCEVADRQKCRRSKLTKLTCQNVVCLADEIFAVYAWFNINSSNCNSMEKSIIDTDIPNILINP